MTYSYITPHELIIAVNQCHEHNAEDASVVVVKTPRIGRFIIVLCFPSMAPKTSSLKLLCDFKPAFRGERTRQHIVLVLVS